MRNSPRGQVSRALRMVMLVSRETIYSRAPFSICDNGCLGVGGEGSLLQFIVQLKKSSGVVDHFGLKMVCVCVFFFFFFVFLFFCRIEAEIFL